MQVVDYKHVKENLTELIDQVANGEEVIIIREDEPLVRMVAANRNKRRRQFGGAKGKIKVADDFDEPLEDFREYM